jgi:polyisoprenoid-binding protein YceI
MRKISILIALVAGMLPSLGALAQQKLLPAQSQVGFTSTQMGVPVEGQFRKFDAQFAFDPRQPEAAKISFKIDLGSVTVGGPETEVEIAKPEWFHTKSFPQASFESSRTQALGAGKFVVTGKLTLKGIAREMQVPVQLTQAGGTTTAVGAFTLKRLDFQLGNLDWKDTSLVANEVGVKFKLALSGVAPL